MIPFLSVGAERDIGLFKPTWSDIVMLNGAWRDHPSYQGCIAHYAFLEGGGTTLYDLSGEGGTATLTNMTPGTAWGVGERGHALDLDGSNDYVKINKAFSTAGDLTWLGRVKLKNFTNLQVIAYHASAVNVGMVLGFAAGSGVLIAGYDGSSLNGKNSSIAMSANVWTDVAVTKAAVAIQAIYLDGVSRTTASVVNLNPPNVNQLLGADHFATQGDFPAAVVFGDVRIYNRQLTPMEILAYTVDPWAAYRFQRHVWRVPSVGGAVRTPRRMLSGMGA